MSADPSPSPSAQPGGEVGLPGTPLLETDFSGQSPFGVGAADDGTFEIAAVDDGTLTVTVNKQADAWTQAALATGRAGMAVRVATTWAADGVVGGSYGPQCVSVSDSGERTGYTFYVTDDGRYGIDYFGPDGVEPVAALDEGEASDLDGTADHVIVGLCQPVPDGTDVALVVDGRELLRAVDAVDLLDEGPRDYTHAGLQVGHRAAEGAQIVVKFDDAAVYDMSPTTVLEDDFEDSSSGWATGDWRYFASALEMSPEGGEARTLRKDLDAPQQAITLRSSLSGDANIVRGLVCTGDTGSYFIFYVNELGAKFGVVELDAAGDIVGSPVSGTLRSPVSDEFRPTLIASCWLGGGQVHVRVAYDGESEMSHGAASLDTDWQSIDRVGFYMESADGAFGIGRFNELLVTSP